ncbi:MAG: hypothetical protein MZV64_18885 [Ignavibacteriales bacterium]|nr:hypothetical protein [Ignavibacteriales bacterium]
MRRRAVDYMNAMQKTRFRRKFPPGYSRVGDRRRPARVHGARSDQLPAGDRAGECVGR